MYATLKEATNVEFPANRGDSTEDESGFFLYCYTKEAENFVISSRMWRLFSASIIHKVINVIIYDCSLWIISPHLLLTLGRRKIKIYNLSDSFENAEKWLDKRFDNWAIFYMPRDLVLIVAEQSLAIVSSKKRAL